MNVGTLIALEGLDGAGKTTQAARLVEHLRMGSMREVVASREPTSGPWGQAIRAAARGVRMTPDEELHAFSEDRREHVGSVIKPALLRGAIVVLDRYYFSTAVYQGTRGFDGDAILRSQETFAPRPDIVLCFDLAAEVAMSRIGSRGGSDAFETLEGLRAVRAGYARLGNPYRIARIDADQPAGYVATLVREAVAGVV